MIFKKILERKAADLSHTITSLRSEEIRLKKKQKQQIHSRSLQIIRNRNSALIEGVSRHGFVEVHRAQTLKRDNLVVRGITGCVLDHVELRRDEKRKGKFK